MTLGVVGLGLIGTSIARAALQRGACDRVIGADPNPAHAASFAGIDGCEVGSLDGTDCIAIATPPDRVIETLASLDPNTTTFDVASVKGPIIRDVPPSHRASFVGSHPIAGNEGRGPGASDPDLFVDRVWVLTPGEADAFRIDAVEALAQALGARALRMEAEQHDAWIALTSHVPNVLANALVTLSPEGREPFEGPSWSSATRVAGGNPELWATILSMNASHVKERIDALKDALDRIQARLDDRAALEAWLQEARCASQ